MRNRRALAMPVDQDTEGIPVTGEHPADDRAVVLVHDRRRSIVAEAARMVAPGRKNNRLAWSKAYAEPIPG